MLTRLSITKDHIVQNPKLQLFGARLTLLGQYYICYNQLCWHVWNNDPDTIGEIVLSLDAGIVLSYGSDDWIHALPQSGTSLEYGAPDFELVRDLEIERANNARKLAEQIVELYATN